MQDRYFDYAATTPLDSRVLAEMLPYLESDFGNANSIHGFGARAHNAVELARVRVAKLIGAEDPAQIIFTSGATESNNQVLRSFDYGVVSPFEHSAVREPAQHLGFGVMENRGYEILPPDSKPPLISVMAVNNEVGTIWEPQKFAAHADYIHSDITQIVGKLPFSVGGLSFASFSAHKFYGPKGIGGLYYESVPPNTLLFGGEQENGLRGGTLDVPSIVGMGAAAAIAGDELDSRKSQAEELRNIVLDGLKDCSDWRTNGGSCVSPYILSVSFLGIEGETLVVEADRSGYAISSGAACSSHKMEPSHVLQSLGIEEIWGRGTVRISFGRFCTAESASGLSKTLRHAVEKLRRMN